jgi:hypothetical protein
MLRGKSHFDGDPYAPVVHKEDIDLSLSSVTTVDSVRSSGFRVRRSEFAVRRSQFTGCRSPLVKTPCHFFLSVPPRPLREAQVFTGRRWKHRSPIPEL